MSESKKAVGYIAKSKRDDWRTPRVVVDLVKRALGGAIDLDPCASSDPAHHFAGANLTPPADGLAIEWGAEDARVFVNPPYSSLLKWVARAAHEAKRGCEVVVLMPSRTDTRAWHRYVAHADALCLWRGRMRFDDGPVGAPFPTVLAYWGPHPFSFAAECAPFGHVVVK